MPVVLVTAESLYDPRTHWLLGRALAAAGLPAVELGQPAVAAPGVEAVATAPLPRRRTRVTRMASGPLTLARAARLAGRRGVLHVTSLELLPWAVVLRRLGRLRIVYDSREDYPSYMLLKAWLPRPLRRPVGRLVAVLEPRLAARLDATTVPDRATAARFGAARRVLVVHNFPDVALTETRPSDPPEHDVLYNGTVAGYHLERIARTAAALAGRGRDVRWCVAARGLGSGERARLERRLAAAGVREAFTLLYDLPFTEMPRLLAASRLGFVPLPDEPKFRSNVPRKVFEFLAAGRTVVASDLPPLRRLLGGCDCCVLVDPGDPAAWVDALERLLAAPALADELGARGRALVRERLNAERECAPYVALCRDLLDGAR